MAKIIGEYRFVFTDESKGAANSSLSSTEAAKSASKDKEPKNPVTDGFKSFSKALSTGVGVAATGLQVYRTIRDVAINKKTTDAVISGNLQAARNLAVQKANQDKQINSAMGVIGYISQGAAIGGMGGGYGAIAGAIVGMFVGISTSLYRDVNEYNESMRKYQAEIAEQKYVGQLTSRRLANITGRVR